MRSTAPSLGGANAYIKGASTQVLAPLAVKRL